jgi:hypothetical protein
MTPLSPSFRMKKQELHQKGHDQINLEKENSLTP